MGLRWTQNRPQSLAGLGEHHPGSVRLVHFIDVMLVRAEHCLGDGDPRIRASDSRDPYP